MRSPSTWDRLNSGLRWAEDHGFDIPCRRREADPEWWFSDVDRDIVRAKEGCFACPLRLTCDAHAEKEMPYGIWGGKTRLERYEERNANRVNGRRR